MDIETLALAKGYTNKKIKNASVKGEKGDPGPQGPKGDKGDKGDIGPAGVNGKDGKDGAPGKDATVDSTLTQSGQAADAKVTGDAIEALKSNVTNKVTALDVLFRLPRTGKVYTVKIPKFASNPTTSCEKLDDNVGLVCKPSTDTVEGQDDYADIPLFKWYNCNYLRSDDGHAYPTAIEGLSDDFAKTGNVDVGVIQMTPYVKWDESNDDYVLLSITDSPKEGYMPWAAANYSGTIYPYVIHSKYFSGLGPDGLLRSIFGVKPERNQSYTNMITNYVKKGLGYKGGGIERNTWQIVFTLIKYATKSSQAVFAGTTNHNFQYEAAIQRTEKLTYFPVTKSQAGNIAVGSYVSVGYGSNNNGVANPDRNISTIHKYADDVKVLKIEAIDDNTSAVYLDVEDGFDTTPVALTSTLNAPIVLSSMHWYSGSTDSVISHHDGSIVSNTNGKYPYRVQGVEYSVGGYTVASDVVLAFDDANCKDIYICPHETTRTTNTNDILSKYQNIGKISPAGDVWVGDVTFDAKNSAIVFKSGGNGNNTGFGDRIYGGGNAGKNTTREYLMCGHLWHGSLAGASCVFCGFSLTWAVWNCLAAD